MKLFELAWGLHPRRIGIYLAEKRIEGIERVAFDALAGWPPPELTRLGPLGTVPILQTDDGAIIRSSIAMRAPFELDGTSVSIGTSVGIAVADADDHGPERLVREADTALYRAKASGRGAWHLFGTHMAAA